MKLAATVIAALGLTVAPLAAEEIVLPSIPDVQTAGVSQTTDDDDDNRAGMVPVFGVSTAGLLVGGAAVAITAVAIAAAADGGGGTPTTTTAPVN